MSVAVAEEPVLIESISLSPRRRMLKTLLRKKIAMLAIIYLSLFYLCGIFAPWIAPRDPYAQNLTAEARLQGPSSGHWLGTDRLGRDIASRIIYATRTTVAFTVVVLVSGSLFLGLGLGLLAGYRGGWVDALIMRVGEVMGGLPTLLLMLAITAAFRTRINDVSFWLEDHTWLGDDARTVTKFGIIVFATVPFAWIGSTRVVRSQALAIREETYVAAAEAMGASTWRVITRHILPGVMPLFIVGVSAGMAGTAGAEVTLSFLGLGIDPPTASFGSLIADGAGPQTLERYPHLLLAPAIPVALFFFAWNLLGDALVDLLSPRTHGLR
jgi:ABC-type dipeptide/oligopeptide/nickel transport system permease subunit